MKYTTLYSYCEICDVNINNVPYSKYCCESCYEHLNNIALQPFEELSGKNLNHIGINEHFLSIYGIDKKDLVKLKLQAFNTTYKEMKSFDKEIQLFGFFSFKQQNWIIFKNQILLETALGFATESLISRRQGQIYKLKHEHITY